MVFRPTFSGAELSGEKDYSALVSLASRRGQCHLCSKENAQRWARNRWAFMPSLDIRGAAGYLRLNRFGVHLFTSLGDVETDYGFVHIRRSSYSMDHEDFLGSGSCVLRQLGPTKQAAEEAKVYLETHRRRSPGSLLTRGWPTLTIELENPHHPTIQLCPSSLLSVNGIVAWRLWDRVSSKTLVQVELPPGIHYIPTFSGQTPFRFATQDDSSPSHSRIIHRTHFLDHEPGGSARNGSGTEDEVRLDDNLIAQTIRTSGSNLHKNRMVI